MSPYQAQHACPSGPGDSRPTALQIVEDEGLGSKLIGKVALVTGANQGIGLETVRALYETGATVFLAVRDCRKGQEAIDNIVSTSSKAFRNNLHVVEMSLDSLESVRAAVASFLTKSQRLNILILNAGVMATPEGKTKDGFETQFGINYMGHFMLTQSLIPILLQSSSPSFNSRVVSLSSIAHRFSGVCFHDLGFQEQGSYDPWIAYGQSKTANIYLANEIERRYGSKGLHALSVHPGNMGTNLGRHLDPEEVKGFKDHEDNSLWFKSTAQGAATTVYAAISKDWEGRGGAFLADCAEQTLTKSKHPLDVKDVGHATWAFDETDAIRLWDVSTQLIGNND
ncbi:related to reductases [Fusarium fujikuroi]|uniref:Reductases n=1 Tax=Fusarium fujikuroi TaxID=5127 RepID=A0A9Q9UGM5_FUSFU|nr:related to reductases [Fusarium fujikuroi]SCO54059.1 related to reductases [Fusarium fujikuroi]VTT78176.1 unnamed protein product [Fusarium fujikuroi]